MNPRPTGAGSRLRPRIRLALLALIVAPSILLGHARAAEDRGGWKVSKPEAQGVDPARLAEAYDHAGSLPGIRSLLVARNGRLIGEKYWKGAGRDRPHNVKSVAKSLLSALVGIALDEGHLRSLDQNLGELLPEVFAPNADGRKRAITIRDLLAMTSGLGSTSGENYGRWVSSGDWVRHALSRPMLSSPGTDFRYSTGNSHLLSVVLARATGMRTREYAEKRLLEPLGIRVHGWPRDPQGHDIGGNDLSLTPGDLARFGQLYLDDGKAGGRAIVPRDWIALSTRPHSEGWPERYGPYGYLWWTRPRDAEPAFMAVGYGGQFLYVVPGLRMLIVMTSDHKGKGLRGDRRILALFREQILTAANPPRPPRQDSDAPSPGSQRSRPSPGED